MVRMFMVDICHNTLVRLVNKLTVFVRFLSSARVGLIYVFLCLINEIWGNSRAL